MVEVRDEALFVNDVGHPQVSLPGIALDAVQVAHTAIRIMGQGQVKPQEPEVRGQAPYLLLLGTADGDHNGVTVRHPPLGFSKPHVLGHSPRG